jgi:hypothetical protein
MKTPSRGRTSAPVPFGAQAVKSNGPNRPLPCNGERERKFGQARATGNLTWYVSLAKGTAEIAGQQRRARRFAVGQIPLQADRRLPPRFCGTLGQWRQFAASIAMEVDGVVLAFGGSLRPRQASDLREKLPPLSAGRRVCDEAIVVWVNSSGQWIAPGGLAPKACPFQSLCLGLSLKPFRAACALSLSFHLINRPLARSRPTSANVS